MPLPKDRIFYLLEAYTAKSATDAEEVELMNWILEAEDDEILKEYMKQVWDSFQPEIHSKNNVEWSNLFANFHQEETVITGHFSRKKIYWSRIAAVVAGLLLLSVGTYFLWAPGNNNEVVKSAERNLPNDVPAPTGNKAVLTLADGSVIKLDSAGQGALAVQGAVKIEKTADGQIIYKGDASEIRMNTLSVPRGSKPVQLILADGSKVWLNAASSVTYPTAFAGPERTVSITGEAYFEIAHDASRPFNVKNGEVSVRVLGTHFNINCYDDEVKVTLLQGSVNVTMAGKSALLQPGQQAQLDPPKHKFQTINRINIDEVMAWINGKFYFEKSSINDVMNQISRWYDIDVEYEGIVSEYFGGTISKDVDLSQVFEMLEFTGGVHFKIIGKKVIVMP